MSRCLRLQKSEVELGRFLHSLQLFGEYLPGILENVAEVSDLLDPSQARFGAPLRVRFRTPRGERLIRDAFGDGPVSSSSIAWASENASSTATAAFCDARLATTRSPSAWMRAARVCVV